MTPACTQAFDVPQANAVSRYSFIHYPLDNPLLA